MKPFHELSRSGQARRLRQMAHNALHNYPITPVRVRLAGHDTNATYRVDATDGSRYALRITSPEADHTLEETQAELAFLAHLAETTDIGAPQPVRTTDGALCVLETALGVPEPRTCTLFTWLPGRIAGQRVTPKLYRQMGDLLARLHISAASWQHPPTLRKINRVFYFNDPILLFKRADEATAALYRAAADRVQHGLDALWADRAAARVIHADLHPWNIMAHEGGITPFDFEDLMLGFPVQDVAISLYYVRTRPDYPALLAAFRAGYAHHLPWPGDEALMLHFVHRGLMLLNFAYALDDDAWGAGIAAWLGDVLPGWVA
jgi:Ser/Thr protein kinase RdoA (MazF antagonist)